MLNILIPMGGASTFFENEPYPKPLMEIGGKTMIELVINNLDSIRKTKKFIFLIKSDECDKFHLDDTINLLTDGKAEIIRLGSDTQGAICTCLLAIEQINNDDELLIVNSDQIISDDLNKIIRAFSTKKLDAGVVIFESVHPKWSYVKIDKKGNIIETAEKKPISKNAIAGFYYFKKGRLFVDAAFRSIEKENTVNGLYYIAPTLNELVLKNNKLGVYKIPDKKYHSFYSPQKIEEYEKYLLKHSI